LLFKKLFLFRPGWWLTLVMPATWKVEIGGL
jgi:hypothetical protein